MAEARYGRQNRYDDIRRVCEGAVSIPFTEYIGFLESAGYLRHDRGTETLEVTEHGEQIVNGGNLSELTAKAVTHFKNARASRHSQQLPVSTVTQGRNTLESRIERAAHTIDGPPARKPVAATPSSEVLDQRYEKLASIGSGGIGHVYRARQVPLNREVALKELREVFGFFAEDQRNEIVRRFTDVIRAAANLAHPNILPIHDVNLDRDFPYVVTELAPNGSGRRLINDAEDIPVDLSIKYLLQTLHALRAAHAQRVYHRGLKPEQLLIDAYGNVKVSDFGFTRIVERDQAVIRQVYVGMGNVAYMAPELYSDPTVSGPQGDIYALGIIFYELLTRKLPGRRSPMPSQLNPQLPKGIDDIFDRMTQDSRDERYSSVDEILQDIEKLEGTERILGRPSQILAVESPLSGVKFREGAEEPLVGTPIEEGSDDDKKGGPSHRP